MVPMWNDMISLGISVPEKVLRTFVVYLAIALLLRLAGRRDLAQLNTMDLVVMLLLSNVVQNAIIGPDNSVTGGLIGAVSLIFINAVVVRTIRANERLSGLLEGTATVLARGGEWLPDALRREGLRLADVDAALRRQNANSVKEVDTVSIEPGGAIIATLRPEQESATRDDIARLEAKLDRLLRA